MSKLWKHGDVFLSERSLYWQEISMRGLQGRHRLESLEAAEGCREVGGVWALPHVRAPPWAGDHSNRVGSAAGIEG